MILKKISRRQQKHAKLPSRQRVNKVKLYSHDVAQSLFRHYLFCPENVVCFYRLLQIFKCTSDKIFHRSNWYEPWLDCSQGCSLSWVHNPYWLQYQVPKNISRRGELVTNVVNDGLRVKWYSNALQSRFLHGSKPYEPWSGSILIAISATLEHKQMRELVTKAVNAWLRVNWQCRFLSLLSTCSTQEDPSWHNWKIVDLDVKNKI